MNFQTHSHCMGYLRYITLESCSWYHAGDACELSGVVDPVSAMNELADDDVYIVDGVELVNINGFEAISKIGQRDGQALIVVCLEPESHEGRAV